MVQRVVTAFISLLLFIPIVIYGNWLLALASLVLAIIALYEILTMEDLPVFSLYSLLGCIALSILILPILPKIITITLDKTFTGFESLFFYYIIIVLMLIISVFMKISLSFRQISVIALACLYIGMGFHYFLVTRQVSLTLLFYALLIVWSNDSGAYLVGKKFGRHKLAFKISPNKTWEGLVGGMLLAVVVSIIYTFFFPILGIPIGVLLLDTILLAISGDIGDLIESLLKRNNKVKDSGNILPGHGGILDRFDSLLLVFPTLHLLGLI